MSTIEQHYEKLRTAAAEARKDVAAAEKLAVGEEVFLPDCALRERMIEELNRQSEERWPVDRAAIAAAGGEMPDGPLRFDGGYRIALLPTVGTDRHPSEHELDTATRVVYAAQALLPELTREAEAAEAAFDAYRRAVAQGVAVAPSKD